MITNIISSYIIISQLESLVCINHNFNLQITK